MEASYKTAVDMLCKAQARSRGDGKLLLLRNMFMATVKSMRTLPDVQTFQQGKVYVCPLPKELRAPCYSPIKNAKKEPLMPVRNKFNFLTLTMAGASNLQNRGEGSSQTTQV